MNNHKFIELFEKGISEYTSAPYVVLTDSCTNAIFLCLKYLQRTSYIPKQALEISIPTRTYISVPQAIFNAGFTFNYKKEKWKGSYRLGKTNIYDYAVGFKPNMYKSNQMQCISFQQKKAIGIGKGGAILLDNKEAYETLKRMSWDGRDASKSVQEDIQNIIPGYHMNMTPEMASTGLLLLNQYQFNKKDIKKFKDYPNISSFNV